MKNDYSVHKLVSIFIKNNSLDRWQKNLKINATEGARISLSDWKDNV
jgi:hypothetical protein